MKKKKILAIIAILVLFGLVLALILGKGNGKENRDNVGKDVIVHESNENTLEEDAEDGLKESDSEDGPILDEETMIDFNGDTPNNKQENTTKPSDNNLNDIELNSGREDDGVGENDNTTEEPSGDGDEENFKDTGAWGVFY
ncbi:MAG: hypothetical protein IJE23_04690 [Tyzzerella sp.]|nr:hypothetical protein [Tyzzerella sp.]